MENNNTENTENTTTINTYTLDGKVVTLLELNEARNKPGIKIVEKEPGKFITLQRLNG